jgi:ABC-type branched-subunit amino acid transport system substrate-binding protein
MKHLTLVMLLVSGFVQAQWTDQEYLLEYKKAVQLYASGQLTESLEKLTPLTGRNYNNTAVPYAMYYYALASYDSGRGSEARAILRDLFQRYPDWEKIDEAYYLYGVSNLKDKYYEEGISYLNRITSASFEENKLGALAANVSKLENVTLLKDLNRKFPLNKTVAETLVQRIQARSYNTKADLELSDQLTNRFDLKDKSAKSESGAKNGNLKRSFDDSVIDFGVLLPFGLDDFNLKEASTSQRYVYDIYYGMQKAAEKLKREKINVRLSGYDVGSSADAMKKYLDRKDFRQLDVVVGPLYGEPNRLFEEYARKNKIYQIHPISNNSELVDNAGSVFLVQPSNRAQAKASLDFVSKQQRKKDVSIYYGGARKDSVMAAVYADEARKRGFRINEIKSFKGVESIKPSTKPGHVFFVTEPELGANVIRALGQRGADSLVISAASSFNLESVSKSIVGKRLYLIAPEFVNTENEQLQVFRKEYINKMNTLPSYYAYLGYDLLLFYGRMLKDGKDIFRLNLNESPRMDDLLLSGFDYSANSAENLIVPVIRYIDGRFEVVN